MSAPSVRDLLRRATTATLATLDADTGHPYASLVEVATLPDARPVLLLSGLARHTKNLQVDPRASLLVDDRAASADVLAGSRATLIGSLHPADDPAARRRYLARYPASEPIAALGDFGFWLMAIDHAHAIAGFGRIGRVAGDAIVLGHDRTSRLANQEAELIGKVNSLLAARGTHWRAVGIDPEGIDVRAPHIHRLSFENSDKSPEKIAETIVYASASGSVAAAS